MKFEKESNSGLNNSFRNNGTRRERRPFGKIGRRPDKFFSGGRCLWDMEVGEDSADANRYACISYLQALCLACLLVISFRVC